MGLPWGIPQAVQPRLELPGCGVCAALRVKDGDGGPCHLGACLESGQHVNALQPFEVGGQAPLQHRHTPSARLPCCSDLPPGRRAALC